MNFYINFDEDLKRKTGYTIAGIAILLGIFSFWSSHKYDKTKEQMFVTVEKITGEYELVKAQGPSPFLITVKEINTGLIYDSFVSEDCPKYEVKAISGAKLTLVRYTNVKINDQTKSYSFQGSYEQLCTNKSFDPKVGDNYLSSPK